MLLWSSGLKDLPICFRRQMRSSVSVILSSPTPDTNMSHPDYEQNAHDHATLLILVKQIGEELNAKVFATLFERICKITSLNITDSTGVERCVKARFTKDYLVGNNDWGDFQTHRRLYGLITVGKCNTQPELNEVCRVHESLKVKYNSTLYDSRCIIVGVNDGPDTPSFPTPSNFKSRAIFYASDCEMDSLESHVTEFLSTLFWVLESKRHERCREKIDKVSLLLAPFERRDFVGLDMESRSNRKRSLGRMTKHLGDLSLQAGLFSDALTHYQTAADILRSINDWLWLAGALEGQCAASAIIHFPNMCQSSPKTENSSLPETQLRPSQDSKGSKDINAPAIENKAMTNLLSPDDIIRHYKEAIVHYSKYQNANVIETEACYKGARLAIQHNAYLHAANFLHSVMLINLALNEEEKIEQLMSLSELYIRIGFQRKASFYRRLAAKRFVSARNPQTNWQQCYNLMLQALSGHKLSLDPADHSQDKLEGWPGLQKQVLQDLVIAATRVGQSAVATRHMTFLLQVMWEQLTPTERHESAQQLMSLAAQCEGSPVPLVLDSGIVIPPVNLFWVPTTEIFDVQNLKPHLRPAKVEKSKENFGPFIFTPINFGSLERKPNSTSNKLDYLWVADELCEVKLEISNPFPFELEVSNMRLLTSGVVFESLPLTIVLPAEANNVAVTLSGTSKEVGQLEITGYSTHTLGVKSDCRLKNIPQIGKHMFTIEVIPALPLLQITSSLSNKTSNGARVSLYAGESTDCVLELENTGQLPVQWLEVSVECLQEFDQVVQWDNEPLQAQLPLKSGESISLPVHLFGAASFLSTSSTQDAASIKSSIFSSPSSYLSSASPRPGLPDRFLTKSTASSYKSGGSSLNSFSSQFSKLCIDNSPKAFQCHLKVRYSSDPGMSAGYCRVATFVFSVEINYSVFITNWDVIPAETCSQFYLVLDIANMTSQELELKYGTNKSLLMEENESCRIPIPVERCPLTKIGKLFKAGESVHELIELNKSCSSHIASLVDLQWSLVTGGRCGKASLHGISLSLAMLDIVRTSPFTWEVSVNGAKVEPQEELSSQVGQSLLLGFNMINSLSWALRDLELSVHFFQDHQNGATNYQLDTRIACSGATSVHLNEVAEFGQAYHECVVVFLTPGQYKVNLQCSSKEKHIWKLIPPLVIQVSKS